MHKNDDSAGQWLGFSGLVLLLAAGLFFIFSTSDASADTATAVENPIVVDEALIVITKGNDIKSGVTVESGPVIPEAGSGEMVVVLTEKQADNQSTVDRLLATGNSIYESWGHKVKIFLQIEEAPEVAAEATDADVTDVTDS